MLIQNLLPCQAPGGADARRPIAALQPGSPPALVVGHVQAATFLRLGPQKVLDLTLQASSCRMEIGAG